MKAGSRVILKYRLLKRLTKIKAFLADCANKQEVRKKIQDSHAKAMDQQQGLSLQEEIDFHFGFDSLQPTFYPLQLDESAENQKDATFKPEGKATFDDLAIVK